MADDKKQATTKAEKPPKPQADKPAKAVDKKAVVVVDPKAVPPNAPIKTHIDQLEELTKIDLDTLGDLDTADLRKKMLQGVYLLEHVLFSQAGFEFKRIQNLRKLIGDVEKEIFDEAKFKNLSESEKLRLYRMMMANMSQSLEFMSNLHKNVTLGIEAVNSIDRIKADKGFMAGAPEDNVGVKDEVDAVKNAILEKIAKKLKDPNARAEGAKAVEVAAPNKKPKKKPKKKKKKAKKPHIQKPIEAVPKENEGGEG